MDLSLSAVLLSALVALLLFYLISVVVNQRKAQRPPGPRGWECVGASLAFLQGKMLLLLEDWHQRFGEVVFCPLPITNMLFLNSPAATRELYGGKATEKLSNDRMWSVVADKLTKRKDVVFNCPSDPSWTKMRKLMYSSLKFYGEGIAEFEKLATQVLEQTIQAVDIRDGQDVLMKEVIDDFITNIIVVLLTGEAHELDSELCRSIKWLNRSTMRVADPAFVLWLMLCPFLERLPGTKHHRACRELMDSKDTTLHMLLQDRSTRSGIVGKVLEYQSNEGADWMDEDYLKGFVLDVIVSGVNTSTYTLHSLFFRLLHHPDSQRAIQQEVDRVVGLERKPALSDRPCCPYTEAFMMESMRMSSILPLGLDHLVTEDIQFRGYSIPKGTVVFNAAFVFNKSASLWTDPDSFRPQRFLDEEGRLLPANHPSRQSLLSFGTGKRSCVGEVFARARIFLFLTGMLQRFDVLPPVQEQLLPLERTSWEHGILDCLHLKPYHVRLKRRQH